MSLYAATGRLDREHHQVFPEMFVWICSSSGSGWATPCSHWHCPGWMNSSQANVSTFPYLYMPIFSIRIRKLNWSGRRLLASYPTSPNMYNIVVLFLTSLFPGCMLLTTKRIARNILPISLYLVSYYALTFRNCSKKSICSGGNMSMCVSVYSCACLWM